MQQGHLKVIFSYATVLALVGLIESILTLKLLEEKTNSPGCYKKECISQGLANIVTGFFGGMGDCAMIGQSMINVESGGTSRLSALVASLFLITFVLVGANLIGMIPIAALIGVMFIVVINTFEWSSFKLLSKMPISDSIIMIAVTVITVTHDLAVAVVIGIVISSLVFAWKHSMNLSHKSLICDIRGDKTYKIYGAIFFSSTDKFISFFDAANDPNMIILDLADAKIFDSSAIDAINKVKQNYKSVNKKVRLINMNEECEMLLNNAK